VFVNAAGPHLRPVGKMVGVDLPVQSEVHAKTALRDHLRLFPREAPMVIWNDPQRLGWSDEEVDYLREAGRQDLLGTLPPGCHGRPEGGSDSPWALGLWEYHTAIREPAWPIPTDPLYAEVVLRGLASIIPGLAPYGEALPETVVDAGYYTKTAENLPLAGPVGPEGSYVCGALSGFGIMAACAVGELVAQRIAGAALPDWYKWFELSRYNDPAYIAGLAALTDSGQL
jgi:glycine/D-amino acid oxidase-like deaminating enzyme